MSNLSNLTIINDLITVILTSAIVTSPFKKKIVTAVKKSKSTGKVTEIKKINIAPKKIKR